MTWPLAAIPNQWTHGEDVDEIKMNARVDTQLNALVPYFDPWTLYNPVLTATTTSPTLGTGSSVGAGAQAIGKTCIGWAKINFGASGTNAGSGNYNITLPAAMAAHYAFEDVIGVGRIKCAGLITEVQLICYTVGSNIAGLTYTSAAVNGTLQFVNSTAPGAWTANDGIALKFEYELA